VLSVWSERVPAHRPATASRPSGRYATSGGHSSNTSERHHDYFRTASDGNVIPNLMWRHRHSFLASALHPLRLRMGRNPAHFRRPKWR
jgi:hypothetical protein